MRRARPRGRVKALKRQKEELLAKENRTVTEEPSGYESEQTVSEEAVEEIKTEEAETEEVEAEETEAEEAETGETEEVKTGESEEIQQVKDGDYSSIIDAVQNEKRQHNPNSGRATESYVSKNELPEKEPKQAKKRSKKKKSGKILPLVIALAVAAAVIMMGFNMFDDDDILAPIENGKINVLLLGVDEEGLRTDAIMIASYDVNEGDLRLLSVPRDTKVYVVNKKVTRKINELHALSADKGKIYGIQASVEAVTQLTGVPINYYLEFSFNSIDNLFDTLGGIEFDVPDVEGGGRGMNYDDPYQNLHIHLQPGMQTLTGNQVQQFLRYRKSNYHVGTGSDSDRVQRQQEFVKAVVDQKLNMTLIPKIPGIFSQLSKEIKTNISGGDITKYIRYLTKLSADKIESYSLPGADKYISGGWYFECDLDATKTLVNEVFGVDAETTNQITLSGKNAHKPLRAGNLQKKTAEDQEKPVKAEEEVKSEEKQEEKEAEKSEEKKQDKKESEEKREKEEKKQEEKESEEKQEKEEKKQEEKENSLPEPKPNQTPLEDIYEID